MVSFTSRSFYPWAKSLDYELDGRLDGPHIFVDVVKKEKSLWIIFIIFFINTTLFRAHGVAV
jgi:hypothetical protein